jgi:3-hydroxybutyryl-CoA dehydratase
LKEAWVIGDELSVSVQVTDETVHKFAEMSGDYNPIHLDDAYAATTRFKRRIAHGMICGALISRVLAEKLGGGGIYLAQTMKFINPVFIDDTVTVNLKVLAIRESKGIATIETICKNQRGEICVKGEATIMMPGYV